MKKNLGIKSYSLTPSQETMHYMLKYSLHKQVMQIPFSVIIDQELDFDILQKAANIEIERNDSLRLHFFKDKKEIRQYVLSDYKTEDFPIYHFKSKSEQKEVLQKDAQKPIRFLKGEVFRLAFFRTQDKKTGIYMNVCHLNMDALAVFLFFKDMIEVYNSLKYKTDMPEPLYSIEEVFKQEQKYLDNIELYKKDEEFYRDFFLKDGEPFYAGVHGMDILNKEREKKKNPNLRVPSVFDPIHDKADLIHRHIDFKTSKEILDFCSLNNVSPAALIQLGLRTHLSGLNERNEDIYLLELCSRRASLKTKRTGGCLAQPLPLRSVISEDKTFFEALELIMGIRNQLYRHKDYPYLDARNLTRKLFDYGMTASASSLMFTWLPAEPLFNNDWEYEFEGYSLGRYIMPLYAFAIPNLKNKGIDLYYMYRTHTISAEQINSMHDNMLKTIEKGIKEPTIKIGKLLDNLKV